MPGAETEAKITEVVTACEKHGKRSIVALAGVPGTGKSYIASIAAQRYTNEPTLVKEIQFHQSFSYEEFIEGLRIDTAGAVEVFQGIFSDWNDRALDDPDQRYVLLIEELTRANVPSVLGELMTYLEYRERPFISMYSRRPTYIAPNLTILATFNPSDRSALELDAALLRRLRIIQCPPSPEQLAEMFDGRPIPPAVVEKLQNLFRRCKSRKPDLYEHAMPFGHGVFADITGEAPDLYDLWEERLRHFLRRPHFEPNPFTSDIEAEYPWRQSRTYVLPAAGTGGTVATPAAPTPTATAPGDPPPAPAATLATPDPTPTATAAGDPPVAMPVATPIAMPVATPDTPEPTTE